MKQTRRWLAGLLCAVLLMGLLPTAALAGDSAGSGDGAGTASGNAITRAQLAQLVYEKFRPANGSETSTFGDISGCTQAQQDAIRALASAGIVSGTGYIFDPGGTLTRAQAALLLWRVYGSPMDAEPQTVFDDVAADAFYAGAINCLVGEGILTVADADVTEDDQALFLPDGLCTVAAMDTWLGRVNSTQTLSENGTSAITRAKAAEKIYAAFSDQCSWDNTDPYFGDISDCTPNQQNAINALGNAGVVSGTVLAFNPGGSLTCGQAALVICRTAGITAQTPNGAISALRSLGVPVGTAAADDPATADVVAGWLDSMTSRVELAERVYNKFLPAAGDGTSSFTDIGNCTAAQQTAINALAAAGILTGSTEGVFLPNGVVTRGNVAVIIWRATGSYAGAQEQIIFSDVSGTVYASAVNALVKTGLLTADDAVNGQFLGDNAAPLATVQRWVDYTTVYRVLTFHANGGSGAMDDIPVVLGGSYTLPECGFTAPSGMRFRYWAYGSPEGNPYSPGTLFGPVKVNAAFYAVWEDIPSSGGSHTGGSSSGSSGSSSDTVTEVTNRPDGSREVVETKKDGTVTTTVTDASGNKTATVERPDGSSEITVDNKDGSGSTTTVTTSGQVAAEVKLPAGVIAAAEGEAVALPMPSVSAALSRADAPTVTVDLPSGTRAMVEIPVEDVTPGTVAVLVKADGSEEVIKTSLTTENSVAVTLGDGDTVKIVDNTRTFADVPDRYWGTEAVTFASSRELFSGTSDTTFSPDTAMNRAMIVTVLARLDGVDTSSGSTWYETGTQWAVEQGISDGSNLTASLTREQLAAMLYRYAGSPAVSGGLAGFSDGDAVSDYAAAAMVWAVESGLITGMGDGTLNPQGSATRAQVAAILMRYIAK